MKHTIIIAEAGVNHNGDITTAKRLIDAAVIAKVDYVKFQTFKAENLVTPTASKAEYQQNNTGNEDSQLKMLKQLELSHSDHAELISYCQDRGIQFFSTAFDLDSIDYLHELGFRLFKIPSGELTNFPYLKKIAQKAKSVILSTGMATLDEIASALKVLVEYGIDKSNITVLHCNTEYPTPMEDVNLKAMLSIKEQLNVNIGYSDHTLGIEVPIAAVALGAVVIEKHFTLDRNMPGPDHKASLEPAELKQMVDAIRNVEKAIAGNAVKAPSKSEEKNTAIARKSIYLKHGMEEGIVLKEEDLVALRPGDGISPMLWNDVIGKQLKFSREAFHKLSWEDFL